MRKPRYFFEDLTPGRVFPLGERSVSREEIIAFAREWDPQLYHLDEEAARETPYGGLIGSGVHSWAIMQRLAVDGLLGEAACLGSPGYERLRFLKPLRPESVVSGRITVLSGEPSRSRRTLGRSVLLYELLDAEGTGILDANATVLFGRRPA